MVEIGGGEGAVPIGVQRQGRSRSFAVIAILSLLSTPWTKPAAM
jgi:hypothetical protein